MPFKDEILAGDTLIRSGIQSENFLTQVSGWRGSRDGDFEINNLVARGEISTGPPPGRRIVITDDSQVFPYGSAIQFWSGDPSESQPAQMAVDDVGNLYINGMERNASQQAQIRITPPTNIAGAEFYFESQNGGTPGRFDIGSNQLFADAGMRSAPMRAVTALDGGFGFTTTSTAYVAVSAASSGTVEVPLSGKILFAVDGTLINNVVGQFGVLSFELRNLNAAGAVLLAADDANGIVARSGALNDAYPGSVHRVISGLAPASGTVFFRCMARSSAGANTANMQRPCITAIPQL